MNFNKTYICYIIYRIINGKWVDLNFCKQIMGKSPIILMIKLMRIKSCLSLNYFFIINQITKEEII